MYYKTIDSNTIEQQPKSLRVNLPSGGFDDRSGDIIFHSEEEANLNGYYIVTTTDIPVGNYRKAYRLEDNRIVEGYEEAPIVPEQPFNISKIKLRHALKEIGLWETFYNILKTADGDLIGEWNDAVVLTSNDPMVLGFSQQLISLVVINEVQIKNLLNTCKSDLE